MVGLIAALSLGLGWLASSTVSQSPSSDAVARPSGARPIGREGPDAPFTQQLRLKLQEHPQTPSPGRNPFVFGARRPAVAAARVRSTEAETPVIEAPVAAPIAPQLRFNLSGIAMTKQDGAEVFTAIVNDNGSLAFVKAGDALSNGYTVRRVEETAVIIVDASGVERMLRLK